MSAQRELLIVMSASCVGCATGTTELPNETEGRRIVAVSVGPQVSCVITNEGRLYCAGVGYGTTPVVVAPTLDFSAVSSNGLGPGGAQHQCALAIGGTAHCWGDNSSGQLGVGDFLPRPEPTPVAGSLRFVGISTGRNYSCALSTVSEAFCWGDGSTGQLGTGNLENSPVPVAVNGGFRFTQLEAGSGTTCALSEQGAAYCWGRNDLGQLGTGPNGAGQVDDRSVLPQRVGEPLRQVPLSQIVTRGPKTCGLTAAGEVYCWGGNTVFELGTSTPIPGPCYGGHSCSATPLRVRTTERFTQLTASQFATCGLTANQRTLCWGLDFQNLFGAKAGSVPPCPASGTSDGCSASPVAGPTGFVTLSGSRSTTCGITSAGIAYCWGGNESGQRGWGGSASSATPERFPITH